MDLKGQYVTTVARGLTTSSYAMSLDGLALDARVVACRSTALKRPNPTPPSVSLTLKKMHG